MAVREILIYPQHKTELRQKSDPVLKVNRQVDLLIQDLKDTLKASSDGIGLAAAQINIHQRLVVVCLGTATDGKWLAGPPQALINPHIIEVGDEHKDFDGCLSFPGLYGETVRPHYLHVAGLDEQGQALNWLFEGFNAVVVHHEIDHLEGVLFIDRIQSIEDLYTIHENERGEMARVPFNAKL